MFVSKHELASEPTLGKQIRNWAANLNLAAKGAGAPTFKISGPCQLNTRQRRPGVPTGMENYMGGEEFRISSIFTEENHKCDGFNVNVIFTPVDMKLVQYIVGITMPLEDAIVTFDGFEEWTKTSAIESKASKSVKEHEREAIAALPTVEETRSGESWGAW
jgi:hypothetical protein